MESLGHKVDGLLSSVSWSGVGAAAALAEAQRIARRLRAGSSQLRELSVKATRTMHVLAVDVARRRALEATMLHDLGRIAAIPGDLEARAIGAAHQLPRSLRALLP